jgi:hypothetical protein
MWIKKIQKSSLWMWPWTSFMASITVDMQPSRPPSSMESRQDRLHSRKT